MPAMSDAIFIDFDIDKPNLAKVDVLLGGVGRIMVAEGVEQIANIDDDTGRMYCYSPALPTSELEAFVAKHMSIYEEINDLHGAELHEGENVEIFPFWDRKQLWASHKLISAQPYLLKQMVYDAKSLLDSRDLSAVMITSHQEHLFLSIDQRCTFGDSYMPIHKAPFHLHFKCNPKAYEVEMVWQAKESPDTYKLHPQAKPFKFKNCENIVAGSIISTARNNTELNSQLSELLDGYEMIGILDSE